MDFMDIQTGPRTPFVPKEFESADVREIFSIQTHADIEVPKELVVSDLLDGLARELAKPKNIQENHVL